MNIEYQKLIANEFRNCVNNTIERISKSERTYRPFHTALLSEEVIFWSGFERSFSTSFGQRVIEELARLVALSNGAEDAKRQKETFVTIDIAQENAILEHLKSLRAKNKTHAHDWASSLADVYSVPLTGQTTTIRVISDMWWKKDGVDHFISLKTVKPNIDQTSVAKGDCLRLSIALPDCKTYFGLPYNPFGENKESYAFNPPMGIFDFHHDPIVLIGKEMWNTIGGAGCYEELLSIAREVGQETKSAIKEMRLKGLQ